MKKLSLALLILATTFKVSAQNDLKYNVVTTAVPILLVSPDSRAGAMGDVGAARTPYATSSAWHHAPLALLENQKASMALYSTPYMSQLVPDIDSAYVNSTYAVRDLLCLIALIINLSLVVSTITA